MHENKIKIGKIINTHGIKGEVKIIPNSSDTMDLLNYKYFYIDGESEKFDIKSSRVHKNAVLIKLIGYDNINDVEKFKSKDIYVSTEDFRKLDYNEHLIRDLIGLSVIYKDKKIGEVKDIMQNSANDVIVVSNEQGNEILIPNVSEFIKKIDLENKNIIVNLIKGMI